MYYIYDDRIAFVETEASGVVAVPFPKAKKSAEEMMSLAKSRYSYVRSLPRAEADMPKKFKNSIATQYAEGTPEDMDTIQSLTVPSVYFVLGPSFNKYRVTEEKYNEFIETLKKYKTTVNKRKMEISSMTYESLLEFFLNHPLSNNKKNALLMAISNLSSQSAGPNIESNLTNKEAMEAAYQVLRGLDESGDETTLNDLIVLGASDSLVEYTRKEDNNG